MQERVGRNVSAVRAVHHAVRAVRIPPSHRKADQAIAITLQLSIVSAIPMPFQHLGPHAVLFWVLNFKPHSSTKQYPGFRANEEASGEDNDTDALCFGALFRDLGR